MRSILHAIIIFPFTLFAYSCQIEKKQNIIDEHDLHVDSSIILSYEKTKQLISANRQKFAATYFEISESDRYKVDQEITAFWISNISHNLFSYWEGTPWDFNGTTLTPKKGTIACGFFVATMLQDMDLHIKRTKLSTCAASDMMKNLVPHQKIKKLNNPNYNSFCDSLKQLGKGVYIIGLDFHVGLIVIDHNCWFIHANYINKQGVLKELVQNSVALQSSETKWLVCLTNDKEFISRWLKASNK